MLVIFYNDFFSTFVPVPQSKIIFDGPEDIIEDDTVSFTCRGIVDNFSRVFLSYLDGTRPIEIEDPRPSIQIKDADSCKQEQIVTYRIKMEMFFNATNIVCQTSSDRAPTQPPNDDQIETILIIPGKYNNCKYNCLHIYTSINIFLLSV